MRAYALVEASQGEDAAAQANVAGVEAAAHGWDDVRVLVHFATSFVAAYAGQDGSAHIQAMVDIASRIEDPALYALSLAHTAARRVKSRQALDLTESPMSLLVRAVALLDGSSAPVVHRAAAMIEVANVSHALGLWELAAQQYELLAEAFGEDHDPRWSSTVHRQRRAVAFNRLDLALDWASEEAALGDWAAAGARAAASLPAGLEAIDAGWPPSWVSQYRRHLCLLAALAGSSGSSQCHLDPQWDDAATATIIAVSAAIRAARNGQTVRAARLADGHAERIDDELMPASTRLLCMSIAARQPGTPAVATAYSDELVMLRWNARINQMIGVRDAIAVERRRREHEQLRHQVLVDDLTGLANRRGYQAYLTGLLQPAIPAETDNQDGYAVMMIDVDHFKGVNDTFGHDIGDVVLARIAQVLASNVRPVDLAARLGGDEFVVILADVGPDVPEARARVILDAVRGHPWEEVAAGLTVSISIGVHTGGRQELPALLTDADRKLYHAKNEGRGRVAGHAAR
ncbi:GGDEF domain-containing protein [Actinoplanes sp. CA-051413]|uniref:GGDEF domain-containing protein n=1 Tax=Actinoplanes sp. CA-051413 TaxID=3239899 RepID=UPI003D99FCA1